MTCEYCQKREISLDFSYHRSFIFLTVLTILSENGPYPFGLRGALKIWFSTPLEY